MKKLQKLFESLKIFSKRIIDNPACLPSYARLAFYYLIGTNRFLPFYNQIKILSSQECMDLIISTRRSFVRFGTGEAQIALGMGFYAGRSAQNADKQLVKRMNDLFEQDKVLIGVGARFLRATDQELKMIGKFNMFFRNRVYLRTKLKKDQIYGEAFAFREDFDFKKLLDYLKTQNLIIISRNNPNIKIFQNNFSSALIEAPTTNAFGEYEKILKQVKDKIFKDQPIKDKTVFLVALGPAAKPLVVDINALGYTAWDVGAFFEDFIFDKYKQLLK
jgi:hypothetical protein